MAQINVEYAAGVRSAGRTGLPAGYCLQNSQNGRSYRIIRTLGGGGFGITYEALDPEGRRVAVKEFFPMGITARGADFNVLVTGDEDIMQSRLKSFSKEAKVLTSLKNIPSVVEIYDIFHANQTAYYVMEYIEGMTMLSFLKQFGLMRPEQTEAEFVRLMHSIDILHEHGIIHRDISPDNIMIQKDGSFKLIDFGSARSYAGAQNLTISLKENFAPLEQYSETGQGRYTDVYSLAATMFYAYTGKLIPLGQNTQKKEADLSMALMNAGLNMQQISVLKKALSANPVSRYQSMKEFAEAYSQVSKGVETAARREIQSSKPGDEHGRSQTGGFAQSIALLKEQPTYLVLAGALFAIALVLQLFL